MYKVLVISIGNTLRGDDGVGSAVLDSLRASRRLPPMVELFDCGMSDLSNILVRNDVAKLIVVDAANMGLLPGEWRRLPVNQNEVEFSDIHGEQNHGFGLSRAISLGTILGTLPEEIVIYAIQPENTRFKLALSEQAKKTVMEVCEAIQFELELSIYENNPANVALAMQLMYTESS